MGRNSMQQTDMSNVPLYLDFLELEFDQFLLRKGISEKTRRNYKSDIRQFLSWSFFTIQSSMRVLPKTHIEFLSFVTDQTLGNYKIYLLTNRIPAATVNRRLSTIRNFFRFSEEKSFIKKNPAVTLTGISSINLIANFEKDLRRDGASEQTIRLYSRDIKEFFEWMST